MVTKPPGARVSEFVAFAILDELVRTLLSDKEAAALLRRVITNVRGMNVGLREDAIPVLEKMLDEYAKQTG